MIQDIKPHLFNNVYKNTLLSKTDKIVVFDDNRVLVKYDDTNKQLILPEIDMNIKDYIYLFPWMKIIIISVKILFLQTVHSTLLK